MTIRTDGIWFKDEYGRTLLLRGVNLGGSSKMPTRPDGRTHIREGFFNHRDVSFVGRPFPLEEADEHFSRLAKWGLTFLRFLVTWEAVEHAGPGQYDEAYLDYVAAVVRKAAEYDIAMFIDPHQDVWSRFSGGDGAPGWTLEAVGFDIEALHPTHAAIVHQVHGDPFPRMIWATNYNRLAAATMFSLFFGGDRVAPNTKIDGVPVQQYLQSHYFKAMQQVALRLKDMPNVVGYDTMNEPSRGYLGMPSLTTTAEYRLKNGVTLTPYQSMLLGWGLPQVAEEWQFSVAGNRMTGLVSLNTGGRRAWREGANCVWRENGVWDTDAAGAPHLLRPAHFAGINFHEDCLRPFINAYAEAIRAVDPQALIFIEADALGNDHPPQWGRSDAGNIVFAPHWYDGLTLLTKRYWKFVAFDVHTLRPVIGRERIRASFVKQLGVYRSAATTTLGGVPTLIGEVGIPYDMNNAQAYRTGDFSAQEECYDDTLQALEANLLNFTLWNYTADNGNARGDGWNGEDLSIFSRDQQTNPRDIHSGGRALKAVLRPYARAIAGEPLRMSYNFHSGVFEFVFRHDPNVTQPTEFYIPSYQYPQGYEVTVSDGTYEIDTQHQRLIYRHSERDMPHFIRVAPAVPRPQDPAPTLRRWLIGVVVLWLLWRLIRRR
ncbi:MAG: cellulase family glycosylhydrolase [Anaerolineae bacterium]